MGYNFGWDDLLGVPTLGAYNAAKAANGGNSLLGSQGLDLEGKADDFMNIGQNRFKPTTYDYGMYDPSGGQAPVYGGNPGAAADMSWRLTSGMDQANDKSGQAFGMMMGGAGQARENGGLSNQSQNSRKDIQDAMGLQRSAALGLQPSQAELQMRQGMDQALANQQAQAGGARGAAGLALAQGNAQANSAALQNQTYGQAAAMRAGEMAQARGAYGGMANDLRASDNQRLGLSNQVQMSNAGNVNNYRLGVGGVGAQYGQQGLGYAGQANDMSLGIMNGQNQNYGIRSQNYNSAQGRIADSRNNADLTAAGVAQANAYAKAGQTNKMYDTVIGLGGTAVKAGGGGK